MQMTKRMLAAGLMAAAVLIAPTGLLATKGGGWELRLVPAVSTAYAARAEQSGVQQATTPEPDGAQGAAPSRKAGAGSTDSRPINSGGPVAKWGAGATGDGPADQAECDKYADELNKATETFDRAIDNGNVGEANFAAYLVNALIEHATNRGCFIIDP